MATGPTTVNISSGFHTGGGGRPGISPPPGRVSPPQVECPPPGRVSPPQNLNSTSMASHVSSMDSHVSSGVNH